MKPTPGEKACGFLAFRGLSAAPFGGVEMTNFRILGGLPSLGDLAVSFPPDWGKLAREGIVVEFVGDIEVTWVGNCRPAFGGLELRGL